MNSLTRKDHSSKYEQLSRGQLGLIYSFNVGWCGMGSGHVKYLI